jgi:hypothetical protein
MLSRYFWASFKVAYSWALPLGVCMGRGGAVFRHFLPRPTPIPTRKPHLIKRTRAGRITARRGGYFEWHLRNFNFILLKIKFEKILVFLIKKLNSYYFFTESYECKVRFLGNPLCFIKEKKL